MSTPRLPQRPWSAAETDQLAALYPSATPATVLAALPGRTWVACQVWAGKCRIARLYGWSEADLQLLRQHYATQGAVWVAERVNRTPAAVRAQASLRGIPGGCFPRGGRREVGAARPAPPPKEVKPPKPAKQAKPPKAAKPPKPPRPVAPPKLPPPALPQPVLRPLPAGTPNLNARVSEKRRKEAPAVAVTAEQIRKLPYSDPARQAYTRDGVRGYLSFIQQQQAA